MGKDFALGVRRWAAVCSGANGEQRFGEAAGEEIIPSGYRRRMGKLERIAVRCMLSVLTSGAVSNLIFCSRFGNIETLSALLRSIAAREPVSPMAFSGSVHNAAPGLAGQIRKERIAHTALAGGAETLQAGLVEAYASLVCDGGEVVVTFADLPLGDVYSEWETEAGGGVGLALALGLVEADSPVAVLPGRAGAIRLIERLASGENALRAWGSLGGKSAC